MKNALIIFTKNPVYGKVKTRLAATIGDVNALQIYKQLIQRTFSITYQLTVYKIVFYSDKIEVNDIWKHGYSKLLQYGNNLGERMMNAFNYMFQNKYSKAVIIGTDCAELSKEIIEEAFQKLDEYDVVIGPATDGGYYLLGLKKMHKELFKNIQWSTNSVLQTTIERCNTNNLSYFLLKELHDVDEEKDLQYMKTIE